MEKRDKEGYWTPLEKDIRDFALRPLTWPLKPFPQAANFITIAGFLILLWAIADFVLYRSFERQVWFLLAGWLTDFIDGPTARNNNAITAFGTAADHTRDSLLGLWMIFLIGFGGAGSANAWLIYSLLGMTIAGKIGNIYGIFLFAKEKRSEKQNMSDNEFWREFLLKDLITTITARVHTAIFASGGIIYIAGLAGWGIAYSNTGAILLTVQLFILGFYLHETFQARYEEKAYRLRMLFQEKIKNLEAIVERMREKRRRYALRKYLKKPE